MAQACVGLLLLEREEKEKQALECSGENFKLKMPHVRLLFFLFLYAASTRGEIMSSSLNIFSTVVDPYSEWNSSNNFRANCVAKRRIQLYDGDKSKAIVLLLR